MHSVPHVVSGQPHCELTQRWPVEQIAPHPPQLLSSELVSVQKPAPGVPSGGHATGAFDGHDVHCDSVQISFCAQAVPHAPQFDRSVVVSMHETPLHTVDPASQLAVSVYVVSYVRHAPKSTKPATMAVRTRLTWRSVAVRDRLRLRVGLRPWPLPAAPRNRRIFTPFSCGTPIAKKRAHHASSRPIRFRFWIFSRRVRR